MTEHSQISPNIGNDDHTMNTTLDDSLDHHLSPPSSSSTSSNTQSILNQNIEGPAPVWLAGSEDRQSDGNDVGAASRNLTIPSSDTVATVNPVHIINETSTNRVSTRRRARGGKKGSRTSEHSQARDVGEQTAKNVRLPLCHALWLSHIKRG